MLKKFFISLSVIIALSFTSCGGESSKEAKELLQKVLQFIGIPHSIIVNVCQDTNRDGFCGGSELFTKLIIQKGETINDIWEKISLTEDGKYFLENIEPNVPILVELQDVANVDYDEGKFTLVFDGFKNKEQNETKEVSILQSMIDAGHLTTQNVEAIRNLNTEYAQDRFYETLFKDLETNINTLREKELTATEAMSGNIKEMAQELIDNNVTKELPDRINFCVDSACVDKEIEGLSDELIISEKEAIEVKEEQIGETSVTDTPIENNTSSSQKQNFILPKGVMRDEVGESNYNGEAMPVFIDFSEVSAEITDTNIRIKMIMVELPSELIYNRDTKTDSGSSVGEYIWQISFDLNADDKLSNDDIFFNFNGRGNNYSEGEKVGNIFDSGISSIYRYDNGSHTYIEDIISYTNINGNTITFDIPKSLNEKLNEITPLIKVQFWTQHAVSADSVYHDYYPN